MGGGEGGGNGGGSGGGGASSTPGAPTEVTAKLGASMEMVIVAFTAPVSSGTSAISSYTVVSEPVGVTASGSASPISVTCTGSCAGKAFAVYATNGSGNGEVSASVHVLTTHNVVEDFDEPTYDGDRDSIFTGTFILDSTTGSVSNLTGKLTEAMTKPPMAELSLTHQLSAVGASGGGLLVTTFLLDTTNTFAGGGFAPGSGGGEYYGSPDAPNPNDGGVGNAYAMIYVPLPDPTTPLTKNQMDLIAYADCTKWGMMGRVCMTGTSEDGYGTVGTMGGFPLSQIITRP